MFVGDMWEITPLPPTHTLEIASEHLLHSGNMREQSQKEENMRSRKIINLIQESSEGKLPEVVTSQQKVSKLQILEEICGGGGWGIKH